MNATTINAHINKWASDFVRAVDTCDGKALAFLIRNNCDKLQLNNRCGYYEAKMETACQKIFGRFDNIYGTEMRLFLTHYFKVAILISNGLAPWDEILKKSFKLLDIWMDLYLAQTTVDYNWLVPTLDTICNLVCKIGLRADRVSEDTGEFDDCEDDDKDKYMKQVLSNVRSKMGRVRGDDTRHPAYIILLGQSIKGCIQLGNMQMAAGFLKTIESHAINYSRALRGPLINYRYYLGKLHMQKGDYLEAEEHLAWAFSNTLPDSIKMRRHILECIIVVRVGLGKLPSSQLLEKYHLTHYCDIIRAVKIGDVRLFTDTVIRYADVFTIQGTILCVEQLKYIAYRTLIKNAKHWWNTNVPEAKQNMLSVELLTAIVRWQLPHMTDQEMLCICVNLIRRGLVKGYISWERLMIVFSNIQPFPPINSCVL
ncbi:PCI domain-containing protein 2 [Babesia sp. Xinjiang]|uniref:PCI domain-containing protein 2 n=1 Tax=Babesia sp. Xinjiang TaxID=462227 RepID=UPI000A228E76|nr:PCI domain-containing protein 2 [Babesia sp. Xinjiang]ORM41877.1 PCI domain-containing protein 2 [Babesia sp. Xinjiang]